MKTLVLIPMFAALLVAQDPRPEAKAELAEVIAVEEQEGDLARAEAMYRRALAGQGLSDGGRAVANLRLGRLLQRLGRVEEAKPLLEAARRGAVTLEDVTEEADAQDLERIAKLREQARSLIKTAWGRDLHFNSGGLTSSEMAQLRWIGEPAVPEVIAVLEAYRDPSSQKEPHAAGLARFLWEHGGHRASAFLRSFAKGGHLSSLFASTAIHLRDDAMLTVAADYLGHPEWEVVQKLLGGHETSGAQLSQRLPEELILSMAESRGTEHQMYVLRWGWSRDIEDPALASRFVALAERSLRSTIPELGIAARDSLESNTMYQCLDGILFLLDVLPDNHDIRFAEGIRRNGLPKHAREPVLDHGGRWVPTQEAYSRLWPRAVICAASLVAKGLPSHHDARIGITVLLHGLGRRLEAQHVSEVLTLITSGYGLTSILKGHITTSTAASLVASLADASAGELLAGLEALRDVELHPELFGPLARLADQLGRLKDQRSDLNYAHAILNTGHQESAGWLVGLAGRDQGLVRSVAEALIQTARRKPAPTVSAGMRQLLQMSPPESVVRAELVLALLASNDEPTLRDFPEVRLDLYLDHPYAESPQHTRGYLLVHILRKHPDPDLHYGEEFERSVIRRAYVQNQQGLLHPGTFKPDLARDTTMRFLVELSSEGEVQEAVARSWAPIAVSRFRTKRGEDGWAPWLKDALDMPVARKLLLQHLLPGDIESLVPPMKDILDGDDNALRQWAVRQILTGRSAVEDTLLVQFLSDSNSDTREQAAARLGARASSVAVPNLIQLLRDPEDRVRAAAAEALNRIRFYHDQQAHWERVLKGLDASPGSATEKLLLQARPGQPTEQRLLAITSLGALGAPEALPFLIEWTTDINTAVGDAAKAAITKIHLNPRR